METDVNYTFKRRISFQYNLSNTSIYHHTAKKISTIHSLVELCQLVNLTPKDSMPLSTISLTQETNLDLENAPLDYTIWLANCFNRLLMVWCSNGSWRGSQHLNSMLCSYSSDFPGLLVSVPNCVYCHAIGEPSVMRVWLAPKCGHCPWFSRSLSLSVSVCV